MTTIATRSSASARIPLVTLLVALLLGGCNSMVAPEDGNVLMPLKVGNMWIGTLTTFDQSGATSVLDTLEIIEEKEISGETWFVSSNGSRFINRTDGLYMIAASLDGCGSCDCLSFTGKYPSRTGDSIILSESLVLLPDNAEPITAVVVNRVVTTDTTITTDAGSYSVHHYRTEVARPENARLISPESRFYKPNLGPVLIEQEGGTPTRRWELIRAELR